MKQGYLFFCYDVLMIFFVQSYLGLKILKGCDFVTGHGILSLKMVFLNILVRLQTVRQKTKLDRTMQYITQIVCMTDRIT